MGNRKLNNLTTISVIILLLTVTYISVGANQEQPKSGGELTIARTADATQLDPHTTTAHPSRRVFELVYNTLVGLSPDMLPQPELAKSWNISEDGTVYTFHLREDVKFHNGQQMTSEDVAFTLRRILDEDVGAAVRSNFTVIKNINTPDAYTVVCELKEPLASFLVYLADPNTVIVNKDVAEKGDVNKKENAIGTGPFQLAKWNPDQRMVLTKNPNYFEDGLPYLDKIVFNIISEPFSIVASLRAGRVDFALLELPTAAISIERTQGVKLVSEPSLRYTPLFINTSRPPLDKLKVRQAMNYAIDREEIINSAMLGEGEPTGPIPPALPYWEINLEESPYYGGKNLEKARELMKEAGFGEEGFSVELLYMVDQPKYANQVQVIQSQLAEIGIDVKPKSLERGIYIDRWIEADLDLAISTNSGLPDPDHYLYKYFYSEGNLSFIHGHWSNDRLDTLLEKGRQESNKEERRKIYAEAQNILIDEAPFIWLVTPNEYYAHQKSVKGFKPLATGGIDYLKDAWISEE